MMPTTNESRPDAAGLESTAGLTLVASNEVSGEVVELSARVTPTRLAIDQRDVPALVSALRETLIQGVDNIPDELKQHKAWVCWRITEINAVTGKFNKIPCYPVAGSNRNGEQGTAADLVALGTWAQAWAAFERDRNYAGVGLAMLPHLGLVAFDADKCVTVENGIRQDVHSLVENTYAEISPSGTGVRAFWHGAAKNGNNQAKGFELYAQRQFVTVTGNQITNAHSLVGRDLPQLADDLRVILETLCTPVSVGKSKSEKLREAASSDPVLNHMLGRMMFGKKMVERDMGGGKFSVLCAFEDQHSDFGRRGGDADTVYFLPHTNGYERGHFQCLHASCAHRTDDDYLREIEFEQDPFGDISNEVPAPAPITDEDLRDLMPVADGPIALPAPFPGPMADAVVAALVAAPKPQPELATLAALIGMAACCPGHYHLPSGGRLNLYGVGVASTGCGKELPRTVAVEVAKAGGGRMIGKPASGQGLEDSIESLTGMLCALDEVAHLMEAINGSNKPAYLVELAGNLLQLFSASSSSYTTRVRAQAKNVIASKVIEHPCLNLIGFATPEKLGQAVSTNNIEDGLLGRLLFAFGRAGVAPRRVSKKLAMPESVINMGEAFRQAAGAVLFEIDTGVGIEIRVDDDANARLDQLLVEFDAEASRASTSFARSLLVRSFEKCERVAGVLAVWGNPTAPVMTLRHVAWAAQLIAASDSAALHFCGEYMHGGQIQADAALVLKTLKRVLKGEIKAQRANELAHTKAGMAPHSMVLRASKLDGRRFDDAVAHLIDLGEVIRSHFDGKQANNKPNRTKLLGLARDE
jgi:hypothetical protein